MRKTRRVTVPIGQAVLVVRPGDAHRGDVVTAEAVLRSMVEMFATGDISTVRDVVADDYSDHQGLAGTAVRGPEGFCRVVESARAATHELTVNIEDLIAEGDRVAARIRWRGTSAAGEPVDRETIDIVRIQFGKAAEHWGAGK